MIWILFLILFLFILAIAVPKYLYRNLVRLAKDLGLQYDMRALPEKFMGVERKAHRIYGLYSGHNVEIFSPMSAVFTDRQSIPSKFNISIDGLVMDLPITYSMPPKKMKEIIDQTVLLATKTSI